MQILKHLIRNFKHFNFLSFKNKYIFDNVNHSISNELIQ